MQARRVMRILLILLAIAMFTVTPALACHPTGPASIVVTKTITSVTEGEYNIIIEGYVEIQNDIDSESIAVIIEVIDTVEAKIKGVGWVTVGGPKDLRDYSFEISVGGTETIPFTMKFPKGEYKGCRNVVEVTLWDIRDGEDNYRSFQDRASFDVP